MAKIPDAQSCTVQDSKITLYLLKPRPKDDKSKFLIGFGFSMENWQVLAAALRDHVNRLDGAVSRQTPNGQTYEVNCNIQTPDGRNPCVNTYWEIIPGSPPNFVTLIP
jgi:hypothetical protein